MKEARGFKEDTIIKISAGMLWIMAAGLVGGVWYVATVDAKVAEHSGQIEALTQDQKDHNAELHGIYTELKVLHQEVNDLRKQNATE